MRDVAHFGGETRQERLRPVMRLHFAGLKDERQNGEHHKHRRRNREHGEIAPAWIVGEGERISHGIVSQRERMGALAAPEEGEHHRECRDKDRHQSDIDEREDGAERIDVFSQPVLYLAQCVARR